MKSDTNAYEVNRHTRVLRLMELLLLLLWAGGLLKPELAYPVHGLTNNLALAIVCAVLPFLVAKDPNWSRHARLPLIFFCGFIGWLTVRWAASGFPAVGRENFSTQLEWCAYTYVAFCLMLASGAANKSSESETGPRSFNAIFFSLLSVLGTGFALHAIFQYLFLYDEHLRALLADIGNRAPTPLERGLIHHFRIKRVASVWGDPNALGCFLALSLGAAWVLWGLELGSGRSRLLARILAAVTTATALPAIYLTGSRGAVLDVALLAFALALVSSRRLLGQTLVAIVVCVLVTGNTLSMHAQSVEPTPPPPRSWWNRSDTVRERLNYAHVGIALIRSNPLVGAGLGGVELHYPQLKPDEARESKYLHNWVLQIAAETGLVGLALYVAFWVSSLRLAWLSPWRATREGRAMLVLCGVFLFDGLIQLSFNQRELMHTFGLCTGLLLGGAVKSLHDRGAPKAPPPRRALTALGGALALGLALVVIPSMYAGMQRFASEGALAENDYQSAETHLRRALRATPGDPWLWDSLAHVYEVQGRLALARDALQRALDLQPQSARLHDRMAQLFEREGNLPLAEEYVRKALNLYPSNAEYHRHLSLLLEKRGDLQGALKAAERAAKLNHLTPEEDQKRVQQLRQRLAIPTPERH
ncbi:MAG: tetratricopeptide repeat protein [Candidatus Hydrogenedentota bacterium]|nr:O-antigen ligase family protein [Candidatus Sumerlaea chitinivorans]RMH24628.1 MAG: tetratricopeptide repeat protein [Candidatus Hydrogenedentota bacterium]GIX45766.1 MAG: hypothetical protein KatS3mg130_2174 [Candidatus Sumerlaea sp.]